MSDLPPPDLMDQSGRLRRLVLALIIGAAAGAAAYLIANGMAEPDKLASAAGSRARGFKFVFYMTGFFGAAAFIATLAIANHFANKKWRESLVARAEVVRKPPA